MNREVPFLCVLSTVSLTFFQHLRFDITTFNTSLPWMVILKTEVAGSFPILLFNHNSTSAEQPETRKGKFAFCFFS